MSKRTKIAGLTLSVILHLFLLLSFLPPKYPKVSPIPGESGKVLSSVEVKLIPMKEPTITSETKISDGDKVSYPTVDKTICNGKDKQYKGVGIIHDIETNVIFHAPEYYPGYIAGLRIGDYILNPDVAEINGYKDFEIMRLGTHLRFHIKTTNICFQEG